MDGLGLKQIVYIGELMSKECSKLQELGKRHYEEKMSLMIEMLLNENPKKVLEREMIYLRPNQEEIIVRLAEMIQGGYGDLSDE